VSRCPVPVLPSRDAWLRLAANLNSMRVFLSYLRKVFGVLPALVLRNIKHTSTVTESPTYVYSAGYLYLHGNI
jgi:hypothetical protein